MELIKLDPLLHDLDSVSNLIYETDPDYLKLIFGLNKEKSIKKIKRLVEVDDNKFGHNFIYVAVDDNKIMGIIIGYTHDDFKIIQENLKSKKNLKICSYSDLFRLFILQKLFLRKVLTEKPAVGDFYINNICVDSKYRNNGFGKFILNECFKLANEKKCKRIFLNVSRHNETAVNFFKQNHFEIYDEKKAWFCFKEIIVYYMQYKL